MMKRWHFEIDETAVTILCEDPYLLVAKESIHQSLSTIRKFIQRYPLFGITFEPYDPGEKAPPIIVRMCEAAESANVGPMAAVAGTIAEKAVSDMQRAGAKQAVVDNGGDIAFLLHEEMTIGWYAGGHIHNIGFKLMPRENIFGICTSSGTIGPAISLGIADAATVISDNVALADACATQLGNKIIDASDEVLKDSIDQISLIPGIDGLIIAVEGRIAMSGHIPEFIRASVDISKIAKVTSIHSYPSGHAHTL